MKSFPAVTRLQDVAKRQMKNSQRWEADVKKSFTVERENANTKKKTSYYLKLL